MLFSLDKISLKIRIVEKERVNKNKTLTKGNELKTIIYFSLSALI